MTFISEKNVVNSGTTCMYIKILHTKFRNDTSFDSISFKNISPVRKPLIPTFRRNNRQKVIHDVTQH